MSAWRYSLQELVLLLPRLFQELRAVGRDSVRSSGDKVIYDLYVFHCIHLEAHFCE